MWLQKLMEDVEQYMGFTNSHIYRQASYHCLQLQFNMPLNTWKPK